MTSQPLGRAAEDIPTHLLLGTSSWACGDWVGSIYPPGCPPADYLVHYSRRWRTVEIDSTWYRAPREGTVDGWREKTPEDFVFSAKVPRSITHEKGLVDCAAEMTAFVKTMGRLGPKLGPLLLQFEYVAKGRDAEEYRTGAGFLARLRPFLETLPSDHRFVVEVRNEAWLRPELIEMLRERRVALALTDYFTMPPVERLMRRMDPGAADFIYVRFLGHHREMDQQVARLMEEGSREREWDSLAVDRTPEMRRWVPAIRELLSRRVPLYAYFNNHYAGYAPGSIELFLQVWRSLTPPPPPPLTPSPGPRSGGSAAGPIL